jgi:hypothetical protein
MLFGLYSSSVMTVFPLKILFCFGALAAQDRLAVPSEADQAGALKVIRDVYGAEFSKTSPVERRVLAQKLLAQCEGAGDNPAVRYVLLREARELANLAGDLAISLRAIESLCKVFAVDPGGLRAAALAAAVKAARAPDEYQSLAVSALKIATLACAADDYESAEKALSIGSQLARKAQDVPLTNRLGAKSKETGDLKARFAVVKKARETLASTPEDGPANLTVGGYLCLQKGEWAGGLPLLAKGADPALRSAAELDLAGPADSGAQLAVGDAWWEAAEKDPASKDALRERAAFWYARGLPKVSGLLNAKAQKRAAEATATKLARGDWVDCSDYSHFKNNVHRGNPVVINTRPGFQTETKLEDLPKGELDAVTLHLKLAPAPEVRCYVVVEEYQLAAFVNSGTHTLGWARRQKTEGWKPVADEKCEHPEDVTLTIVLSRGEYILYVDNLERGRIPTPRESLKEIILNNYFADVTVDRIKVRRLQ